MDEWKDGWMDGGMDGWVGEWIDGCWLYGWMVLSIVSGIHWGS
jgi:hypothetical protein